MATVADSKGFCLTDQDYYSGEVMGLGLTAAEELMRFKNRSFQLQESVEQLLSFGADTYDAEHRLERHAHYRVCLVPSRHLHEPRFALRTTAHFLELGERLGCQRSPAELQFRLHERFSPAWFKKLQFYWLATLHQPISNTEGHPTIMYTRLFGEELSLTLDSGSPLHEWHDSGVLAFIQG